MLLDQAPALTLLKGTVLGAALVSLALFATQQAGMWLAAPTSWLPLALGLGGGYLAADFLSGAVHWYCDSFFSPETPLIGRRVIAPFRDHHDHPRAIVGYRLLQQDSTNYAILVPLLLWAWSGGGPEQPSWLVAGVNGSILGFACGSLGTNLFHKWAHAEAVPPGVRWLQRRGVILSPEAHERHHASYTHGYCVTSGWMNRLLDPLDFFGRAERAIRVVIGGPGGTAGETRE